MLETKNTHRKRYIGRTTQRVRQHTIKQLAGQDQERHGTRQQVSGAGSRPCQCECLRRCVYRRAIGGDVLKREHVERRQCAAVERGGESGTSGVG